MLGRKSVFMVSCVPLVKHPVGFSFSLSWSHIPEQNLIALLLASY